MSPGLSYRQPVTTERPDEAVHRSDTLSAMAAYTGRPYGEWEAATEILQTTDSRVLDVLSALVRAGWTPEDAAQTLLEASQVL